MNTKCPKAPDGGGHHFVPVYSGRRSAAGEQVGQMICAYCSHPLTRERRSDV